MVGLCQERRSWGSEGHTVDRADPGRKAAALFASADMQAQADRAIWRYRCAAVGGPLMGDAPLPDIGRPSGCISPE